MIAMDFGTNINGAQRLDLVITTFSVWPTLLVFSEMSLDDIGL